MYFCLLFHLKDVSESYINKGNVIFSYGQCNFFVKLHRMFWYVFKQFNVSKFVMCYSISGRIHLDSRWHSFPPLLHVLAEDIVFLGAVINSPIKHFTFIILELFRTCQNGFPFYAHCKDLMPSCYLFSLTVLAVPQGPQANTYSGFM